MSNFLDKVGWPLLAIAPVVALVAVAWNYLLRFAYNDGIKVVVYVFMCLLTLAGAAFAQRFVPDRSEPDEAESPKTKNQ